MYVLTLMLACTESLVIGTDTSRRVQDDPIEVVPGATEDTGDTATPDTHPCDNLQVADLEGNLFSVPALLRAELHDLSPEGSVGDGLQDLFLVSLTAPCGNITLQELTLSLDGLETTSEADKFIAPESEVRFSNNGLLETIQYGEGFNQQAEESTIVGVHVVWNVWFDTPTTVYVGEGLNFYLSMTFGPNGGAEPNPIDAFHVVLTSAQSWYGVDDPEAYPDPVIGDMVMGHTLTYSP